MFVVVVPYPPSGNALTYNRPDNKGRGNTDRYQKWLRAAGWDVRLARRGDDEPLPPPYHIVLELVKPDNRKRDIDNAIKAVSDLLVEHRVIEDDSLTQHIEIIWRDGGFVGARVTVRSLLERAAA